ncbi:glycoside hydrolase family 127 protein [bacterium]|nr:MAG: glycoside hydrolase family 127 protein [bacterium]
MAFRARYSPVSFGRVQVTDAFWGGYFDRLVETTLPHEYRQIVETGRLKNLERAAEGETGGYEGIYFNDSDVYKWLEAVGYALALRPNEELKAMANRAIRAIQNAQEPDGYLNSYFQLEKPNDKWKNLGAMHEMYCGGHLIEAGVAWHEALGDDRLLEVSRRFADHLDARFGPGKVRGYCGHEEVELALVRLGRATGETRYTELARWMVEERGGPDSPFEAELADPETRAISPWMGSLLLKNGKFDGEYAQDHAPIREHTEIVGHAVRAMYLYMAATDLADGKGDDALESALVGIWDNLTKRRMYVTGGIGPSAANEGFTADYDLPNLTAYAETCAAVGLVLWAERLGRMTGNSEYLDVLERALYNGVISGISMKGDGFFYDNPLESDGRHERVGWFGCACCPPNIARLLGQIGQLAIGESSEGVTIHMPISLEAQTQHGKLRIAGGYPYDGKIEVSVDPSGSEPFAIRVRVPGWANEVSFDLDDHEEEAEYEDGYAVIRRVWKATDVLKIDFGMEPVWVEANPRVRGNLGRVALTMGPLVYCGEDKDFGLDPRLLTVDTEIPMETRKHPTLPVKAVEVEGIADEESFPDELYAEAGTTEAREASGLFIPYFAWNNRGKGTMQVWVRRA